MIVSLAGRVEGGLERFFVRPSFCSLTCMEWTVRPSLSEVLLSQDLRRLKLFGTADGPWCAVTAEEAEGSWFVCAVSVEAVAWVPHLHSCPA